MIKQLLLSIVLAFGSAGFAHQAAAHCQIPCGIYDDKRQFDEMREHVQTIEKSMEEIIRLSGVTPLDIHSISRWTANKETHAQKIQLTVSEYFMTQRVVVADPISVTQHGAYQKSLSLLHQILVAAMKSKQTTDAVHVEELNKLIDEYEEHYFKDHGHTPQ